MTIGRLSNAFGTKKGMAREAKGEDVKKLRRRWKEAKAVTVHEPGSARATIDELGITLR